MNPPPTSINKFLLISRMDLFLMDEAVTKNAKGKMNLAAIYLFPTN